MRRLEVLGRIWRGLPADVLELALAFDGSVRLRRGRYMDQLRRVANAHLSSFSNPAHQLRGRLRPPGVYFFNADILARISCGSVYCN